MAGQVNDLELTVAQVKDVALIDHMDIFPGVLAFALLVNDGITAGVLLIIDLNGPVAVLRADTVAEIDVHSGLIKVRHRPVVVTMIMAHDEDKRFGGNLLDTVKECGGGAGGHQAIEQDTHFAALNVVGGSLEVIKETVDGGVAGTSLMQLVEGKVVPCGPLDPPLEAGHGTVLHTGLGGIALALGQKPDGVIRQVLVIVQTEAWVGGIAGNVVEPVAPAGAYIHTHAAVLNKQALQLRVGVLIHLHTPMYGGALGGREPLGTDPDEPAVADRHGPHRGGDLTVDVVQNDARLGIGDTIGGIQRGVGAPTHKAAPHQDVQRFLSLFAGFAIIGEGRDIVGIQLLHVIGTDDDNGGILAGHNGHGIEAVPGAFGGEHAHVQRGFDWLDIVGVSSHIIEVAHPLSLHHIALVIDVSAVIHDRVIVGPAEVSGQTDHKCAAGDGSVHFDRVSAGRLTGVERDLVGILTQAPGNHDIIAAHAVAHYHSTVGVHGDQVLVAGAPGALGLHLAAVYCHQFDWLNEFQGVFFSLQILCHAINIDAVPLFADVLLLGVSCGGRDDSAGQDRDQAEAGRPGSQALDKVPAGNAVVSLCSSHSTSSFYCW